MNDPILRIVSTSSQTMKEALYAHLTNQFIDTGTHDKSVTLPRKDYCELVDNCSAWATFTLDETGVRSLNFNGPAGHVAVYWDKVPATVLDWYIVQANGALFAKSAVNGAMYKLRDCHAKAVV